MSTLSETTERETARYIKGSTIAWGGGHYYDFDAPNPEVITLEDAAYALAYTVRWRGQTRDRGGQRCFYGVAQHCVVMATGVFDEGNGAANALAALWHEDDEIVLPDWPGPVKTDAIRAQAKKQGDAIRARFGIPQGDRDLIKRFDVRMLVTERRDLMAWAKGDRWEAGCEPESGNAPPGYGPLPHGVVLAGLPPEYWAEQFIAHHRWLAGLVGIPTE